jgi:hypothetical protein
MPEETTKQSPASPTLARRMVKVGDIVHLVVIGGQPKFPKMHVEAKVERVHSMGTFVDLIVVNERPDLIFKITKSPRDDSGTQDDSWHFAELTH